MKNRPNLQSRVVHLDNARFFTRGRRFPIVGLVWHETHSTRWRGPGGTGEYLNSGEKQASYHYAIEDDGTILRVVKPDDTAWHAGKKCYSAPPHWKVGDESVNGKTIGIAFVCRVARSDPPTYQQLESGLWLGSVMIQQHGLTGADNLGHREIAPTWKSDPMAEHLDMTHWRRLLALPEWPRVITPFPSVECPT